MKIPRKFLVAAAGLFTKTGKSATKFVESSAQKAHHTAMAKKGMADKIGSHVPNKDKYLKMQSAWSKKKAGGPTFAQLEGIRLSESSLQRGRKMKTDKYGNKHTLSVNDELGRVNQWRRGETYAPGESSKFNPFK